MTEEKGSKVDSRVAAVALFCREEQSTYLPLKKPQSLFPGEYVGKIYTDVAYQWFPSW